MNVDLHAGKRKLELFVKCGRNAGGNARVGENLHFNLRESSKNLGKITEVCVALGLSDHTLTLTT